jgi:hypothetical protein
VPLFDHLVGAAEQRNELAPFPSMEMHPITPGKGTGPRIANCSRSVSRSASDRPGWGVDAACPLLRPGAWKPWEDRLVPFFVPSPHPPLRKPWARYLDQSVTMAATNKSLAQSNKPDVGKATKPQMQFNFRAPRTRSN